MNAPDYAARAAAGAAFLDGQVPGWAGRIELATLSLIDDCCCILGQLNGTYNRGVSALSLTLDEQYRLGFLAGDSVRGWAKLDAAWAREIVTRREAADPEYAAGQATSPAQPTGGTA